jgi:hypothetical protein
MCRKSQHLCGGQSGEALSVDHIERLHLAETPAHHDLVQDQQNSREQRKSGLPDANHVGLADEAISFGPRITPCQHCHTVPAIDKILHQIANCNCAAVNLRGKGT